ncbi:hypothetical protein O5268_23395 [Escherichia coli]|nr:hypothetical protein [Escherichia coli]
MVPISVVWWTATTRQHSRALINDAEIIIADEPTGALDEINSSELIKILRELNSSGKTIVMVTHDINIAKNVATRLIKLEKGVIIYDKKNTPADEVYITKRIFLYRIIQKKIMMFLLKIYLKYLYVHCHQIFCEVF